MRPINLWFGLQGLKSSKLRAALTTLGIIIGVAAVIIIVSLGTGLRRLTERQMESWSKGVIEVRPMGGYGPYYMEVVQVESAQGTVVEPFESDRGMPMPAMQPVQLEEADVEALARFATAADGLSGEIETWGQAIYRGEFMPSGQILGVTPGFLTVYDRPLKYGRFVTEYDSAVAAPVVVIGERLANTVFGEDVNPVGQAIHILTQNIPFNFEVIGVLSQEEDVWDRATMALLVPLRTARLRLKQVNDTSLDYIAVRVDARAKLEREYAVAQVTTLLRARHGLQVGQQLDFSVYDTLAYSEEMQQVVTTITLVLSLIAGISLVVGSIGLMNIMLVSVSERTAEVGLRRAMGAKRSDILGQFLAEAVLLSLLGGLIGLGLGILGSQLVSQLIEQLKDMVSVTIDIVIIALGVSGTVGILAGIYPAWHAALLQPTDALRHA